MQKYLKSDRHLDLCKRNLEKGSITLQNKNRKRISDYYLNPKVCLSCWKVIDYKKRYNKFCCSSCAASFNNKLKGERSEETKLKISKALKGKNVPLDRRLKLSKTILDKQLFTNISFTKCKVCGKFFVFKDTKTYSSKGRKTCSTECNRVAVVKTRTYQNGSRKPEWYFNKWENKNVLLESSWEKRIAMLLDSKNVEWIRPKHIKWFDGKKDRLYFPDFYLVRYDLYLDPKNPYCMSLDTQKMNEISKKVNIVYGDINYVESKINELPL